LSAALACRIGQVPDGGALDPEAPTVRAVRTPE